MPNENFTRDGVLDLAMQVENADAPDRGVTRGMTLRDYFAAAALQGMLANAKPGDGTPEEFAADAYSFALPAPRRGG